MNRGLRTTRAVGALLVCWAVGATVPAWAGTYRWVTPDGAVHFGDAMPSDQAVRGYDIIDPSTGSVLEHIDRAKTPQELQAIDAQKAAQAKQAEAAEAKQRHDDMLLDLYASSEDIRRARNQRLAEIDKQIQQAKDALARNQASGEGSLSAAATAVRESLAIRRNIAMLEDRRDRMAQQFDADLKRFKELRPGK